MLLFAIRSVILSFRGEVFSFVRHLREGAARAAAVLRGAISLEFRCYLCEARVLRTVTVWAAEPRPLICAGCELGLEEDVAEWVAGALPDQRALVPMRGQLLTWCLSRAQPPDTWSFSCSHCGRHCRSVTSQDAFREFCEREGTALCSSCRALEGERAWLEAVVLEQLQSPERPPSLENLEDRLLAVTSDLAQRGRRGGMVGY